MNNQLDGEDQKLNRITSKEKPRPTFTGRLVRATVLVIVLPIAALSACAPVDVRSTEDVRGLAGTWRGTGYVTNHSFLFMTLVIHEDGAYELTGSVTSKGVIKIQQNYVKCGPFDLWVYGSGQKRTLRGHGNAAQV